MIGSAINNLTVACEYKPILETSIKISIKLN